MMRFTTKQGDTRTALKATLQDAGGATIKLDGASVLFYMGATVLPTQVQEDGVVWVTFNQEDLAVPGLYRGEFRVTYPDGKEETFPNSGYIQVHIQERLGGA